jgi:hypothetical protein
MFRCEYCHVDDGEGHRPDCRVVNQEDRTMSKKPDGGPAFPEPPGPSNPFGPTPRHSGLSLRDWFAGMALQGLIYRGGNEKDAYKIFSVAFKQAIDSQRVGFYRRSKMD